VNLKVQQNIATSIRTIISKAALAVVLGASFFGIATSVQEASQAQAATISPATSNIQAIIQQVFGADAPSAMRIVACESNFNPNAVNSISIAGSHAQGLFQILYPSTWNTTSQAGKSPFDPMANTLAAHEIFVRDGHSWREWACQP
jgi:hypothetical protein